MDETLWVELGICEFNLEVFDTFNGYRCQSLESLAERRNIIHMYYAHPREMWRVSVILLSVGGGGSDKMRLTWRVRRTHA